ncbi:uncharacterized protein L3040_007831 [Drepanopeziza brunnea f. sp. 'multigermtubi']|uniref:uncharacterized protein n=2 Tax=Drepanopeziza brunnea f. sp. 'multigermtubi' TaxID=698441 RepID=UPI0023945E16|nr:hypothetical protein L3040_007831 [Drepanopeziza brunnea f. sp. 'multigermtubi']
MAIRGFSLSGSAKTKTKAVAKPVAPASRLGKRARADFGDGSEGEEEGGEGGARIERVSGFGVGGAEREGGGSGSGKGERGPLVIPRMPNRDWRGGGVKGSGKDLLPAEERARREGRGLEAPGEGQGRGAVEGVDVVNGADGGVRWGLTVTKKRHGDVRAAEGSSVLPLGVAAGGNPDADTDTDNGVEIKAEAAESSPQPKSADEEALASLLGTGTRPKRPELVIQATGSTMTELESYKAAVASAPPVSTIEDYERIPVEEFGAAMLRGMGWKGDGDSRYGAGKKGKEVKRRQNLLGLGAKELQGAEELGAWVQKSDVKRLKPGTAGGGGGSGGGRMKAGDYKRERDRERDRREERGGGSSYKRERERERERERDGLGHRDRRR